MTQWPLLGIRVQALTMADLTQVCREAVAMDEKIIVANHNLHSVYLYHHQPFLKNFFAKAKYIHIDGIALVIIGRMLGYPIQRKHRVTYIDWIRPLIKEAVDRHWKMLHLGGEPEVVNKFFPQVTAQCPGLHLQWLPGYFPLQGSENQRVLQEIREYAPQLLLVGMGMPRQEQWILENLTAIQANVILPAGACFDYLAGIIPTPPRWLGQIDLEWLYRLNAEPGRLWKRYLWEPWCLLPLLAKDIWRTLIRKRKS